MTPGSAARHEPRGAVHAERARLQDPGADAWRRWGPYLSERAWGTVREDYSADGRAWEYFPHDHARSRAYRWSEDGLAGIRDRDQHLCFAFAFWNGRDPIVKERIFGLTGNEANHGEDAKEYWWYTDATPSHAWLRWQYVYPQAPFPYEDLVATNRARTRHDPEYELLDTGVFAGDAYWDITVDYAKAGPDDLCIRVRVRNAGPAEASIEVLPPLWFRNTWSWGEPRAVRPALHAEHGAIVTEHPGLPRMTLAGEGTPPLLFCDNDTNSRGLWGVDCAAFPKDGINDHVVHGLPTVNQEHTGTKAALRHRLAVAAGDTAELRLRLSADTRPDLGSSPTRGRVVVARRPGVHPHEHRRGPHGFEPMSSAITFTTWLRQICHPACRRNGTSSSWPRIASRFTP